MPIIRDPNVKKSRKNPYALDGKKIRPIPREEWGEDRAARAVMVSSNAGKLSKGRNTSRSRFGSASAGGNLGGNLGGGTYEPTTAPRNPGSLGTT